MMSGPKPALSLMAAIRSSALALSVLLMAVSPSPAKDFPPSKLREGVRPGEIRKPSVETRQGSRPRQGAPGSRENTRGVRAGEQRTNVRLPKEAYNEALAATRQPRRSSEGIWDASYLNGGSDGARKLKTTIERYENREIGGSARDFDVANKTAETIDKEALSKGFSKTEEALPSIQKDGSKVYYRKDKSIAPNSSDPGLARQIFYANRDGGLIRVKPDGDYAPEAKRPQPHVSRSIRFDANGGIDWPNEAFKLGPQGQPLPKSPSLDGPEISEKLKSKIPEKLKKDAGDAVADETHVDLRLK
jgi:hypothetical protein